MPVRNHDRDRDDDRGRRDDRDRDDRRDDDRGSARRSSAGFYYQPRSQSDVAERAAQQGGMYDSIIDNKLPYYKSVVGANAVRILPPTWANARHYGIDAYVHRDVGPDNQTYLCLKEMQKGSCPICDDRAAASGSASPEELTRLKPGKRVLAWVIDRNNEREGPKIWDMGWTMDKDISSLCVDKRRGDVLLIDHPNKGYDVEFVREGTKLNTKYIGVRIGRNSTPISDDPREQEKWLEFVNEHPLPSTLQFYSVEHIEKVYTGKASSRRDEDTKVGSSRSVRSAADQGPAASERDDRSSGRRSVRDEEDDRPARSRDREEDERPRRSREEEDRPRRPRDEELPPRRPRDEEPKGLGRPEDEEEPPPRRPRDQEDRSRRPRDEAPAEESPSEVARKRLANLKPRG